MKKSYSQIWKYLEGKLLPEEEEELMNWMGESERNTAFFNQVIDDFDQINSLPPSQSSHYKWYWAAASLLLFFTFSIWFFDPFISDSSVKDFQLPDGSKVTIGPKSNFEYDSISFASTKWIKIRGTGEISTQVDEHLLVETQNGYLMLEGNSSLQIQSSQKGEMEVFVEKGNIRWLNPSVTTEELAFAGGEKLVFKNDGKTVLYSSSPGVQKPYLILDNYMNHKIL